MNIENLFFDWKSQDWMFVGDRMMGPQRWPHANSCSLWLCYLTQQMAPRLLPADLKVGSLSWVIQVVPVWAPGSLNWEGWEPEKWQDENSAAAAGFEDGGGRGQASRDSDGLWKLRKAEQTFSLCLQTEHSPLAPWFQPSEARFGFLVYPTVCCLKPRSCGHLLQQQQKINPVSMLVLPKKTV